MNNYSILDAVFSVFEKPLKHHTKIVCKSKGSTRVIYNSKRDYWKGIPGEMCEKKFNKLTVTDNYFIFEYLEV